SRRRHTRSKRDWSSDVCSSDLSEQIYEAFYDDYSEMKTFFHGHSYTGNQLGCAVALENLAMFEEMDVVGQVAKKSSYVQKELQRLEHLTHVGEVRQRGFMVGIELVQDKGTREAFSSDERMGY